MIKKLFFVFLLLSFAALTIFFVYKDLFLKRGLEYLVSDLTGFPTSIEKVHLKSADVLVADGLKMYNPPGFSKALFGEAPYMEIHFDFPGFFHKKIHFYNMKMFLAEINILRNEKGISNIELLRSSGKHKEEKPAPGTPAAAPKKDARVFFLDHMEVAAGHVFYEDRSSMIPKKISVHLKYKYYQFDGVPSGDELINIILRKIISSPPLSQVTGLSELVPPPVMGFMKTSGQVLGKTTGQVAGGATKIMEETTEFLKPAAKTVFKDTLGEAKTKLESAGEEIGGLMGKIKTELRDPEKKTQEEKQKTDQTGI